MLIYSGKGIEAEGARTVDDSTTPAVTPHTT
jgi:hypothetical protein